MAQCAEQTFDLIVLQPGISKCFVQGKLVIVVGSGELVGRHWCGSSSCPDDVSTLLSRKRPSGVIEPGVDFHEGKRQFLERDLSVRAERLSQFDSSDVGPKLWRNRATRKMTFVTD